MEELARALVDYLQNFIEKAPHERLEDVYAFFIWITGLALGLVGLVLWLVRRATRNAAKYIKERDELAYEIARQKEAIAGLNLEKRQLSARLEELDPERLILKIDREMADGNLEPATVAAETYVDRHRAAHARAHELLAERELTRVEDGHAALENGRLQVLGWISAQPTSETARDMLRHIETKQTAPPPPSDDEPRIEAFRKALQQNADDVEALCAFAWQERNAGFYRLAFLLYERAVYVHARQHGWVHSAVLTIRTSEAECARLADLGERTDRKFRDLERDMARTSNVPMEVRLGFESSYADWDGYHKGNHLRAARRLDVFLRGPAKSVAESDVGKLSANAVIADLYLGHGDYRAALDLIESVVSPLEAATGISSGQALYARHVWLKVLTWNGRFDDALREGAILLERYTAAAGVEHPDTLVTMVALADLKVRLGHVREAAADLGEICTRLADALGERHIHVIACRLKLCACQIDLGDIVAARSLAEELHAEAPAMLGTDRVETVYAAFLLARIYDLSGEADRATALLADAAEIAARLVAPTQRHRLEIEEYIRVRRRPGIPAPTEKNGSGRKPARPRGRALN